jgi:hypothetical protein
MAEQIPQGFTPEVWNQLTPQQKEAFLRGNQPGGQPAAQGQPYPQGQGQPYPQGQAYPGMNQGQDMMKNMQKMTIISMVFSMLSGLVYSLINMFRGSSSND